MVRTSYGGEEENSSEDDGGEDFAEENDDDDVMDDDVMDDDVMGGRSFGDNDIELDEFDSALTKMSITPKVSYISKFEGQLQPPKRMPSKIRPSTSPESL